MADRYQNNGKELKKICFKDIDDDMKLPFYKEFEPHIANHPNTSHFISKLLLSFTWLYLIVRIIDGITDIVLTIDYLNEETWNNTMIWYETWNHTGNKLAQQVALNSTSCVNNPEIVCCFRNMKWCMPGIFSAIILLMTYIFEVKITVKDYPDHYREWFSGLCCKNHNKWWFRIFGAF